MARSVKKYLPKVHLCMALSDVKPEKFNINEFGYDSVISVEDLKNEIDNLESWIFRHDVMELSTAIKPYVMHRLMNKEDCKVVLFLDPDCYMFSHPYELLKNFYDYSILLTPHQEKLEFDDRMMFREINHLRYGIYNLGFIGVKNDDIGRNFAVWWKKRLSKFCLIDFQKGLFTDQRWIDHVPVFFKKVKILHDTIYNVACWNFRDRLIQVTPSNTILSDGTPICFFHFAGVNGGFQSYMNKWGKDKESLKLILEWYLNELKKEDNNKLFSRDWPYDKYKNGKNITFLHRLIYRDEKNKFEKLYPKPYSNTGNSSFYEYISKLNLPNYSRKDILFGVEGSILYHIKKNAELKIAMAEILKNTSTIKHAQEELANMYKTLY